MEGQRCALLDLKSTVFELFQISNRWRGMERQKGALLDLDRIKNERLLRFQKLQSLQVGDQNSCKQIRKVKAGICKIQKAHKLEADTNTNKITNTNTIKTLNTNTNSKYKSLPSCATKSSKTGK